MKAKSKVLLGLLVALAMMIFAVPAFAADTFTLSEITAPEYGYQGKNITVSIDVTATATGNAPYTAKLETLGGTSMFNPSDPAVRTEALSSDSGKITFSDLKVADAATGEYTLMLTVTDKNNNSQSKQVKVKVEAPLKAAYTDVNKDDNGTALTKEGNNKAPYMINTVVVNDNEEATYQWQMGDPAQVVLRDAAIVDAKGWTNVDGQTMATFTKAAAMDDNGKYVRCIVSYRDQKVVAGGYIAKGATMDAWQNADSYVTLSVVDKKVISFTSPTADDTKTVFVNPASTENKTIDAKAVIGDDPEGITYTWKVNGKEVPSEHVQEIKENNILTGVKLKADAFKEAAKKAGTYVYTCEAKNADGSLTAVSPSFTYVVVEKPVVTIKEAVDEGNQAGSVYVSTADLEKDQTFTAEVKNPGGLEITEYSWTVGGKAVAVGKDVTSWTGKVKATDEVECTVTFKDTLEFDDTHPENVYTATVVETSGQLSGGIYTSNESGLNPSNNPTYTITLPAGLFFNGDPTFAASDGIKINTPDGMDAPTKTPATVVAGARELSFKYTPKQATTVPYVKNMVVTIDKDVLSTDPSGDNTKKPTADVTLPVSESVGYKITRTVVNTDLKVTPETKVYDGKPIEVEVTGPEGIGEISDYRYDSDVNNTNPKKKTVTTEAPIDVGAYGMYVNVAAGEKYGAATDVRLKKAFEAAQGNENEQGYVPAVNGQAAFAITQADNAAVAENPDAYFTYVKEKEFTGEVQDAEVKFADGITGAGVIDKVSYWQDGIQVTPNAPGEYVVKVSTKKDDTLADDENFTNVAQIQRNNAVEIGVFTIKKATGESLYTLKETEADYTGQAIVPEIVVKDGAGAVKATHYYAEGDTTTELTAIVQPGKYDVYVDSEEGEVYAAVTKEKVGTFTINNPVEVKPTYQFATHVQDIGWSKTNKSVAPGTSETIGVTGQSKRLEAFALMVPENYTVDGFAHIQNLGDTAPKRLTSSSNYQIPEGFVAYEFGTTGRSLRIEAVKIGIKDPSGKLVDGFDYQAHVQNLSWLGAVRNGSFTGTRGQSLRLEAIKFDYAGTPAETKPAEETPAEETPATPETPAE